jgi:hypothetical protein
MKTSEPAPGKRVARRQVLADLTRAEADDGPTRQLLETRRVLEAEIHALETALKDWDDNVGGVDR